MLGSRMVISKGPANLDLSRGLVARWTFDNLSGGVIQDIAGNHNGTYDQIFANVVDGVMQGAMKTQHSGNDDGQTSTVVGTLPMAGLWDGDFTVSYWRKSEFSVETLLYQISGGRFWFLRAPGFSEYVYSTGSGGGFTWMSALGISSTTSGPGTGVPGRTFEGGYIGGRGMETYTGFGGWFHVLHVGKYDSVTNVTTLRTFINGVQQGGGDTWPFYVSEANGNFYSGTTTPLKGKVPSGDCSLYGDLYTTFDDFRVFNRAISDQEIKALVIDAPGIDPYQNEVKANMTRAYYRMRPKDGNSNIIKDESGRGGFDAALGGLAKIVEGGGPFELNPEGRSDAIYCSPSNHGFLDISGVQSYLKSYQGGTPSQWDVGYRGVTYNLWFRLDAQEPRLQPLLGGANDLIIDNTDPSNAKLKLGGSSGSIALQQWTGTTYGSATSSGIPVFPGNPWTMLTVAMTDPTFSASGYLYFYIDTVYIGRTNSSVDVTFSKVGQTADGKTNFHGYLADVAVMNRPFPLVSSIEQPDVARLFNKGTSQFGPNSA